MFSGFEGKITHFGANLKMFYGKTPPDFAFNPKWNNPVLHIFTVELR